MDKESYELYKQMGICVRCKVNKAMKDRVLCGPCNEEQKKYGRDHNENRNRIKNSYRKRKRVNGLCIDCGRNKVSEGHTRCDECLYVKRVKARLETFKKRNRTDQNKLSAKERFDKMALGIALDFIRRGYITVNHS